MTRPDPAWRGVYRARAIPAGIATALYVMGLMLVGIAETPPANPTGAEMLAYVAAHRARFNTKQLLWLLPSLPMMVVSLALVAAGSGAVSAVTALGTMIAGQKVEGAR